MSQNHVARLDNMKPARSGTSSRNTGVMGFGGFCKTPANARNGAQTSSERCVTNSRRAVVRNSSRQNTPLAKRKLCASASHHNPCFIASTPKTTPKVMP